MKMATKSARRRSLVRSISRLFVWGLACLALSPLYFWWCLNHSGELTLKQTISAGEAAKGFDFGPVYVQRSVPGRYFIKVDIPAAEEDFWLTSFEVLDSQLLPVYRQDELRYIGENSFKTGQTDAYAKSFTPDKASGYYYFRFKSDNGVYSEEQFSTPVVEFMVRQGVVSGYGLWAPTAGLAALGLILLVSAIMLIGVLGRPHSQQPQLAVGMHEDGEEAPAQYGR